MDDEEYKAMKAKEDRERELEDSFLDDYNADEIASEAGSEALSESLLEDDEASDIEDSWDEKEFEDGGKRDMEAIHERARARARAKRMKRNKFVAFNMPKISDLKKKAGLLPRTPDGLKKRKKRGKAEEEDETLGIIGEMVDSAKEVLAYFAGEETYEVRKFDIWDIPEVCDKIYETQRRRSIITFLPYFYKLDLTGFRRYYKPATETLLVACRSKYVKPHYIVDLLENGADPNVKEEDTDNSPLHYLCRRGNYQGVRYLVDAGANPIAKNAGRRTPLHSACDTGRTGPQVKIVRYLLKQPGVKECIEHRDSGGNTAAINAIFKNNVWILRTLLLAGARVTEEDPYWGYESAYHVAKWVYAAGLLLDVDQLPAMSHQEDWDQLSLRWRYTAPKGHYKHMPVLWVQTLYKYNAELCFRMCQNKKRAEDSMTYPPRAKREVIKMAEKKRDERRQKRMDKEEAQRRKERNNRKLVNRKLHNEVKEVDDWNLQRELIAKSIDSKYEKGEFGDSTSPSGALVVTEPFKQVYGRGGFPAPVVEVPLMLLIKNCALATSMRLVHSSPPCSVRRATYLVPTT